MNDLRISFGVLAGFSLLAWPLLILLHELGHAVPALLLTRSPVTVYLGSYGDDTNSWQLQVGQLKIYLRRSLFWTKGICIHTGGNLNKVEEATIILGGVLISVLVAVLGFYGALVLDLHGSVKLFAFMLVVWAFGSSVTNLVPSQHGGMANDGMLLKHLLTGDTKRLTTTFSPELKELIAKSREVAIDLGCDYISTLHLFLADCAMSYPYSLAGLFFPNRAGYGAFYEGFRIGPANAAAGSLPLTKEFEQALRLASQAQQYGLRRELYPCHLFMASSEMDGASWVYAMSSTPDLPQLLLDYYRTFDELLAA